MQAFTPIGVTVADISATVIYTVYRAIVIAKLIYSSSAWWGFTTAADRQRLEAVIRKAIRLALCDPDQLSLAVLVAAADDDLFFQVMYNDKHVPVLVLVKSRQRAVLMTPVCPVSYVRSAISRLLNVSSEPASATVAGRLFQTGIVR